MNDRRPLRILWFVNIPFPEVCERMALPAHYGGNWMIALSRELSARPDLRLRIVCVHPAVKTRTEFATPEGLEHLILPMQFRQDVSAGPADRLLLRLLSGRVERRMIDQCVVEVQQWQPDIVHVHGTEQFFGLITPRVQCPVVVSIQGILGTCLPYYWGSMSLLERLCHPKLMLNYLDFLKATRREKRIFTLNGHFVGRTKWDRAFQHRLNPQASYYKLHECIRPVFFVGAWQLDRCTRFTVLSTTSSEPWKGTETLVRAVNLLREEFPKIRLRLIGKLEGTRGGQQLKRLISTLGCGTQVEFLGQKNAEEIRSELENCHVFAIPSFIENGSNSLSEAQIVGAPCIATHVGGMVDMLDSQITGIFTRRADPASLADAMLQLFLSDSLTQSIATAGRGRARDRHQVSRLADEQVGLYWEIIRNAATKTH